VSSAEEHLGAPSLELVAALVWDQPALAAAGTPGATAFVEAFGPPDHGEPTTDETPLGRAAQAVVLARGGAYGAAAPHLEYLRRHDDGWTRLLGLLLIAWSAGSEDVKVVEEAGELARHVSDRQLRARLLNKASLFAYDKGWNQLGASLLAEARDAAAESSQLRMVLEWGAYARSLQQFPRAEPPSGPDPLVELDWVSDTALNAARAALELQAEDRMSGTWSWTIRMGRTPLDAMIAAEEQATWAAAHWMRPSIRKQTGANMLSGAAATPEQWAYGLSMWILGGGKAAPAFVIAEPHLDAPGADRVVETLAKESGQNAESSFKEAAIAAWAVMSDRVASAMFERVAVEPVPHVAMADAQRMWAGLLWRAPDQWQKQYTALSEEQKRSLVSELPPQALAPLPTSIREDILSRAMQQIEFGSAEGWTFYLAAFLAEALKDENAFQRILRHDPPADGLVAIAQDQPARDLDIALAEKEGQLIAQVARENTGALSEGRVGFGGRSFRVELGHVGALRRTDDPDCIPLLLETAVTIALPGEFRTEARQALSILHRASKLSKPVLDELHRASDDLGVLSGHGNVTSRLLMAFRFEALAPSLSPEERLALVACCRDPDPRVRVIAMQVCSAIIKLAPRRQLRSAGLLALLHRGARARNVVTEDDALVWGLVSGLFDPTEDVVRQSLKAVGEGLLRSTAATERVAIERLPRIYQTSADGTRAAVIYAARRLLEIEPRQHDLERLVESARADKSWQVRHAATENVTT
jgi:hypothetical protein